MVLNEIIVSVIIPVYNVKNYLSRCVRSVLNQTFQSFELILIDDGSNDGSAELCDEFAKEDHRVIVHHKKNEGVSNARNAGLSLAKGEYVAFIDSDDFIEKDYLEILYENMKSTDADVVCCGYDELSGGDSLKLIEQHKLEKTIVTDYNVIIKDLCDMKAYGGVVWGKLIKRTLIGDARFSQLRYGEDTLLMMDILQNASRVCLVPYVGYNYIRWADSATKKLGMANINRELDMMELYHHLFQMSLKYKNVDNINKITALYVHRICKTISSMIYLKQKELYRTGKKELILEAISEVNGYPIGKKGKIVFFLYKHFSGLLWMIYRCKAHCSQ